jgi:tetratricopeptide (TPR) repeat protein
MRVRAFLAAGCGIWTPALQSTLTKAARLARRGTFGDAAEMLESEVYTYRDSFVFFYLLGLCSLYCGNYGGAHDYLSKARKLKPREAAVPLALAALHLKRADSRRAIGCYLEAQALDPGSRIAKRGLAVLRKYGGSDDLRAWAESERLEALFPPLPKEKPTAWKVVRSVLIAALIVVLAAIALLRVAKTKQNPPKADAVLRIQTEAVYNLVI